MLELLLAKLETQQQMSALFDYVFDEVSTMFDLRMVRPLLRPAVTAEHVMVYGLDLNAQFDADFNDRKPYIEYSVSYILKGRMLGLDAAIMIAHELGHYARDACDLSDSIRFDELTLCELLAHAIVEEGVAMAFQDEFLKRTLKAIFWKCSIGTLAHWKLKGLSNHLIDRVSEPIGNWLHERDIRNGGNPKVTQYSFTGFRIYNYGRSEIRRIRKLQQVPMRSLILNAAEYATSASVMAAASRVEKRLVSSVRRAFKNPDLTPAEVKNMLSD